SKDLKDRSELLIRERDEIKKQRENWQQMDEVEARHKEILELHRSITEERHKLHEEKKRFLKERKKWEKQKKHTFRYSAENIQLMSQSQQLAAPVGSMTSITSAALYGNGNISVNLSGNLNSNGNNNINNANIIANGNLLSTVPTTITLKPVSSLSRLGQSSASSVTQTYPTLHPLSMMGGSLKDTRAMANSMTTRPLKRLSGGDLASDYAESECADTIISDAVTDLESLNSLSDEEHEIDDVDNVKSKIQFLQLPVNEYE
ncbi:sphingosine kinase related protein, partial [Reticulomyxa filosa]